MYIIAINNICRSSFAKSEVTLPIIFMAMWKGCVILERNVPKKIEKSDLGQPAN
jgi:hypothetical protein